MSQPKRYILFYSKQCKYSREFLVQLYKHPELFKKFSMIDVNNKGIKLPSSIQSVPTIIVPGIHKEDIHTGPQALSWLEMVSSSLNNTSQQQSQQQQSQEGQIQPTPGGIEDYDPSAMSGFSDSFTLLDNGGNAILDQSGGSLLGKNFQSLSGLGMPIAPSVSNDGVTDSDKLREEASKKALNELQAQRERDIPPPVART